MQERPSGSKSLVGGLARSQAKTKRRRCSVLNSVTLVLGPNMPQTGSPPCPQVLSIYEIKPPNAGHTLPLWAMNRREQRSVNWPTNTSFKRSKSKAKKVRQLNDDRPARAAWRALNRWAQYPRLIAATHEHAAQSCGPFALDRMIDGAGA